MTDGDPTYRVLAETRACSFDTYDAGCAVIVVGDLTSPLTWCHCSLTCASAMRLVAAPGAVLEGHRQVLARKMPVRPDYSSRGDICIEHGYGQR